MRLDPVLADLEKRFLSLHADDEERCVDRARRKGEVLEQAAARLGRRQVAPGRPGLKRGRQTRTSNVPERLESRGERRFVCSRGPALAFRLRTLAQDLRGPQILASLWPE